MNHKKRILNSVYPQFLESKKRSHSLSVGNYLSLFKSRGIEFDRLREYVIGDNPQRIDWRSSARKNKPWVKEYSEEKNARIFIVFDVSSSVLIGGSSQKIDGSLEILDYIMNAAVRNGDQFGAFFFSDQVYKKWIPLGKGKKHAKKIIDQINNYKIKNNKKTDIQKSFKQIIGLIKRRSLLLIFSDFQCQSNFRDELKRLGKRHDVVLIRVSAKTEKELPDLGLIQLEDIEGKSDFLLDTSDPKVRELYNKEVEQKDKNLLEIEKSRIGFFNFLVGEDIYAKLKKFLKIRRVRMSK